MNGLTSFQWNKAALSSSSFANQRQLIICFEKHSAAPVCFPSAEPTNREKKKSRVSLTRSFVD